MARLPFIQRMERVRHLAALASVVWLSACADNRLAPASPAAPPASAGQKPRWVVMYPKGMAKAIYPLALYRQKQGYQIMSGELDVHTVLNSEPTVKELRENPRRGDCLVIVGASVPRPGVPPKYVVLAGVGEHGSMKGLISDNIRGLDPKTGEPRLAVGRLPATSPRELTVMVDKIIAYEKNVASGKAPADTVCLVGNPLTNPEPSYLPDRFISSVSRSMYGRMHKSWTLRGAADVGGHPLEVPADQFTGQVDRHMKSDYAVMAFFGHSGPDVGVSKKSSFFKKEEWNALPSGGRRGLFFTCGCYGGLYQDAYAMRAVRAPHGPVAAIAATANTNAVMGYLAGQGLVDNMKGPQGPATVGEWWLNVQKGIASRRISPVVRYLFDAGDGPPEGTKTTFKERRREHLEMWRLIGDPATRMPSPGL